MQTDCILETKRIFNTFAYSCRTLLRGDSLVLQPNIRENMEFPAWQSVLDNLTLAASRYKILGKPSSEYVSICLTHDNLRKELLQWLSCVIKDSNFEKSKTKSESARNEGNGMFLRKHYKDSLKLYSTSVRYAPFDSAELGLAFGNVSAALFHLGNYEKCLEMIAAAVQHGYPSRTKYKLWKRRAECYEQLDKGEGAVKNYQIAKKAIIEFSHEEFPNHRKAPLLRDIDAALSRLTENPEFFSATDQEQEENLEFPVPTYGENPTFAYASSALDLVRSEEKGRYVKTNRDVKQGDILFVEKPYTFILLPGHEEERCHHCFKPILSLFPCSNCVNVSYCNEDCKNKSWQENHQWECYGAVKLFTQVGIAHLGMRVLLKTGDVNKVKEKFECARSDQNMTSNKIARYGDKEDNYSAVYHLLPQIDRMNAEDSFQYALTAALLTLYLHEYTDYFHEKDKKLPEDNINNCDKHDDVIFIGRLIHRHIAQLVCNAHAILELQCSETSPTRVLEERQVRIGTAIYPSASMMNHSCDPRIFTSFCNEWLVVRACRDISKDEEVFNCYGPHYRRMNVQQRQEVLQQQYFFTCKCEPCAEPKKYEYQKRFSGLLCGKCDGPLVEEHDSSDDTSHAAGTHEIVCLDCGNKEPRSNFVEKLFKALDFAKTGEMLFDEGDYREARHVFKKAFELQQKCMYKHNDELTRVADRLAYCNHVLGDTKSALKYLEVSIAGVEEKFGSTSVELGNELQKVTDLMLQNLSDLPFLGFSDSVREMFQVTFNTLDRAEKILELNYGPWHQRVREIKYKKKMLKNTERNYSEQQYFLNPVNT